MPLTIKRSWNPDDSEKKVLNHLKKLFKDDKEEVFLFHNVLIDNFKDSKNTFQPIKPDFILVSPSRGIAIIEIKSWDDFSLVGDHAILKNGKTVLNPLIKAQNYFFNFHKIVKKRNHKCELLSTHLKSHIVFTNQIHNPDLMGRFFDTHFINYTDTLDCRTLFNNISLSKDLITEIMAFLEPALNFTISTALKSTIINYHLDEKQIQTISKSPYGHYLVSGVPGSGKSILVVSRALYLKELFPDWKILILCSNRNLSDKHIRDLEHRTGDLLSNVECQTYISFISSLCNPDDEEIVNVKNLVGYKNKLDLYRSKAQLRSNWDAIIVDEYQDFNDKDFEIILGSCKKHQAVINREERLIESLFLAGDMLQKIRDDGCTFSWEKMNIHITGRSIILKMSYRCTPEILKFSLQYLKEYNKTLESEVNKFYEGTDDIEHGLSTKNSIHFSEKWWEDEMKELQTSVQNLIRNDVDSSNIIIIAPKKHQEQLDNYLRREVKNGLLITTPHTVKGLEASHVFVFNFSSILHKMKKDSTVKARMVYMLMTRANLELHVNSYGSKDEDFNRLKEIVNEMREGKKIA